MIRQLPMQAAVTSYVAAVIPVVVYRLNGEFNSSGNTDYWLQLFDATVLPGNGAVPTKSWRVQSQFAYNQHEGDGITCKVGAVFALSITDATLTLDTTSGDSVDIQVEIEEYQSVPTVPAVTSASITGAGPDNVIPDGNPPGRLASITVSTVSANPVIYIMVMTVTIPVSGTTIPIFQKKLNLAAGVAQTINFGQEQGLLSQSVDPANCNTTHTGMTLALSTTPGVYTAYVVGDETLGRSYYPNTSPNF